MRYRSNLLSRDSYGRKVIEAGNKLCKKKNKNEVEERAAKAFEKMMKVIMIQILIFIIVTVFLVAGFCRNVSGGGRSFLGYIKRTGHMENGQVRYVQKRNQYISLEELNISEELQDGDELTLFFDETTDELVFGMSKKKYERQAIISIGAIPLSWLLFVICYFVSAYIGDKTCYRDFEIWYRDTHFKQ